MGRSRTLALTVLCAAMMMIILDGTIVTVALPAIQRDLGFSSSGLAWVVNAYLIAFGGLLLLFGRLGDLIGRRRVFLLGLALFTAASAACGLARSADLLIVARFVQGIGAAAASSVVLAIIATEFPESVTGRQGSPERSESPEVLSQSMSSSRRARRRSRAIRVIDASSCQSSAGDGNGRTT